MLCPKCQVDTFRVIDSRQYYDCDAFHCMVVRRRSCFACSYEQRTVETVEKADQTICSVKGVYTDPC